ncbi:MAG: hypothetical protein E7633_04635 [Ruminococcaceae bacterium]|nr:hypothetical protein [Oscillospiraceae bacterium]
MKLLSFGEIIWDVFPNEKHIGGAPLNLAAHFARQGGEAWMLSSVGKDDLGTDAIKEIAKFGVKTDFISLSDDLPTGMCLVTLDSSAVPHYDLKRNTAYDRICLPSEIKDNSFDFLTFGTLAMRDSYNREAIKELLSFKVCDKIYADINIRPPFFSKESVLLCLENADFVKISDEELPTVLETLGMDKKTETKTAAKLLSERFANLEYILITLGKDGSFAYSCRDKTFELCQAPQVEVVSTVGAGDSFGATFLVEYSKGCSIPECLKKASEISAFVVTKTEAVPEY